MKYLLLAAVGCVLLLATDASADVQVGEYRIIEDQYGDGALSVDHTTVTGFNLTGNGPCNEVEKCVGYNGPCLWDPDDGTSGAALVGTPDIQCILADWSSPALIFSALAKGRGLVTVTVRFDPWGWEESFSWYNDTGGAGSSGNLACLQAPQFPQIPTYPHPYRYEVIPVVPGIPNQVPGFAIPMTMTVSVTAPPNMNDVMGLWTTHHTAFPPGCPYISTPSVPPDTDADGDGYMASAELWAGTNKDDNCGEQFTNSIGETYSLSWPSDTYSNDGISFNKITLQDLTQFTYTAPGGKHFGTVEGQPGYLRRYDIHNTDGDIDIQDFTSLTAGATYPPGSSNYPPMFNGVRAYGGPACQ